MTKGELAAELAALLQEIDTCEREAEALVADLTEQEVNWQERPGQSWSVAQCLDHLTKMNVFYVAHFLPPVERARQAGRGPFAGLSSTPIGRWFANSMEPSSKRKQKAPSQAVPASRLPLAGLVEAFKRSHDPYRAMVAAAADVDVNRVTARNPFIGFVRMRVSTVMRIIPAHDRRHLVQAANVKRALRGA
jgi:DinB superfamily